MTGPSAREATWAALRRAWRWSPDAYLLGVLCALAVRVDARLIRRLRRALGPQVRGWRPDHPALRDLAPEQAPPMTAATEGRLWMGPMVAARGPSGFELRADVLAELRRQLEARPDLLERARRITHERHPELTPEMRWEELLVWQLASDRYDALDALLEEPLAVLLDPARAGERPATGAWLYGVLHRLPPRAWENPRTWLWGLVAAHRASPEGQPPYRLPIPSRIYRARSLRDVRPLPEPTAHHAARLIHHLPAARTALAIRRVGTVLSVRPWPTDAAHAPEASWRVDVLATRPCVVEVQVLPVDVEPDDASPDVDGDPRAGLSHLLVIDPDGEGEDLEIGVAAVRIKGLDGAVWTLAPEQTRPSRYAREIPPPLEGRAGHFLPRAALSGRTAELNWLRAWGEGSTPHAAVRGALGSGRSALVGAWQARTPPGQLFVWRGDLDGDPLRCLTYLARRLGHAGYWAIDEAIRGASDRLLIVLDDLGRAGLSHPEMRRLFEATRVSARVRVVVIREPPPAGSASSEPLADAPTLDVGPLADATARAMLERRGSVPPELVGAFAALAEGDALTLSLMETWLHAQPDPAARLNDARAMLEGQASAQRVEALVRRLVEQLGEEADAALGERWSHPLVRRALREAYGDDFDLPRDHVLSALADFADKQQNALLKAAINAHVGDPRQTEAVPAGALRLFEALEIWDPRTAAEQPWKFWRSCGATIGRMLRQPHWSAEDRATVLRTLREKALAAGMDWRQHQVASIALAKSKLLASEDDAVRAFMLELWERGFPRAATDDAPEHRVHPQLTWTVAKDIEAAWQARLLLRDAARLEPWARDRLVLSLVQLGDPEKRRLGRLDRDHPLTIWLQSRRRYLLGLLTLWAARCPSPPAVDRRPATVFDLPITDREGEGEGHEAWRLILGLPPRCGLDARDGFTRPPMDDDDARDETARAIAEAFVGGAVTAHELRIWFDLASLQIEVTDTSGYAGGRYYHFQHITGVALAAAGAEAHRLALALAKCHDEGVRWGLAQRMGTEFERAMADWTIDNLWDLVEPDDYWSVAEALARDDNEWVPRDTLDGIRQLWQARHDGAGWRVDDDARLTRVARAVALWLDERAHYTPAYLGDVEQQVELLRVVCRPFGDAWWRLRDGGEG